MAKSARSSENAVRVTERARLRALVARDVEEAGPLHADDFQLITPGGERLSKDDYLGMIASGELQYLVWDPEDIAVHTYGEDAAAIRYRSEINVRRSGELYYGRYWHTDTYERRADQWQVVWS